MELRREINEIYVYELLRNFGLSLIGLFLPIYILSEGFSIYHAGLFIAVSGFTSVFFSYPVSKVIARKGFKHGLAASYLLIVPALVAIRMFELSLALIVVSSFLYNLGRITHNICLNSEFAVDSRSKSRGTDSSMMLSLPSLSRVIAPVLGGIVFASLGFQTLLAISIGVLLVSIIPLMLTEDHRDPLEYDFWSFMQKDFNNVLPIFVSRGIDAVVAATMFGVFVYTVIGGTVDVGWARAMDSLGFAATGLITGKLMQKYGDRKPLIFGALGNALVYILRLFVSVPFQAFAVSFLGGIFFQIYHVPLYSRFADMAEDSDVLEFYTLRKMFVGVGNLVVVATLLGTTYLYDLEAGFNATFVVGALGMVLMAYMID